MRQGSIAGFQAAFLATLALAFGGNLYQKHQWEEREKELSKQYNEHVRSIRDGEMERVFHTSQTKSHFIPAVEKNSRKTDRLETLYRIHLNRAYEASKD